MAESSVHMEYVEILGRFAQMILPENEHFHILLDTPQSTEMPPQVINNYRPDLFYRHNNSLIIGEAKTDQDFDRPHSIEQYKSYLKECASFPGESMIVLSGSWRISPAWANMMRNIRRSEEYYIKVMIINELGLFKTIE